MGLTDCRNAADAQDRIMQLHELANKEANEYSPVLLILTWEEETLDEVSERVRTIFIDL